MSCPSMSIDIMSKIFQIRKFEIRNQLNLHYGKSGRYSPQRLRIGEPSGFPGLVDGMRRFAGVRKGENVNDLSSCRLW
jgi:hypothetical protein